MPNVVVVAAHPDSASFTLALARAAAAAAAAQGAAVAFHDLYADGFDPRMPAAEVGTTLFADELTARYAREVLAADVLVVVHPIWFFHVPAILKGWVDRVLRDGVVYELGAGGKSAGLWRVRSALVVNSANSPEQAESSMGDPVGRFWRDVVLGPAGVRDVRRVRYAKVLGSSAGQREAWLAEVEAAVVTTVGAGG